MTVIGEWFATLSTKTLRRLSGTPSKWDRARVVYFLSNRLKIKMQSIHLHVFYIYCSCLNSKVKNTALHSQISKHKPQMDENSSDKDTTYSSESSIIFIPINLKLDSIPIIFSPDMVFLSCTNLNHLTIACYACFNIKINGVLIMYHSTTTLEFLKF